MSLKLSTDIDLVLTPSNPWHQIALESSSHLPKFLSTHDYSNERRNANMSSLTYLVCSDQLVPLAKVSQSPSTHFYKQYAADSFLLI